ncbi:MAG TPA: hypothetical protein VGZ47_04820 [Gemmataceae bacterium]|jgi:hypothetical protein|nr:hypothetical protein [Gemmataceae bacterium]
MKRIVALWILCAALLLGTLAGCSPDATRQESSEKSSPADKSSAPKPPKPPTDDPG